MIRLKSLLNINEIWNISGHSSPHGGKVFPEIIVDYDRGLTSIRAGNEEITVRKQTLNTTPNVPLTGNPPINLP